jgi:hypothetical protein
MFTNQKYTGDWYCIILQLKHSKLLPSNSTLEDKRDYQAQLKAQHNTPKAKAEAAAEKQQWRIATAVAAVAAAVCYAGMAVAVLRVCGVVRGEV